jgi:hypothetical protein
LIRRATVGTGKLTVGGFAKWFKLDVENQFIKIRDLIEVNITNQLSKEMKKVLREAEAESWVPKQPMYGK